MYQASGIKVSVAFPARDELRFLELTVFIILNFDYRIYNISTG